MSSASNPEGSGSEESQVAKRTAPIASAARSTPPIPIHAAVGRRLIGRVALFAIWLLLIGTYSTAVFYVVIASLFVASGEGLLVVSTRASVDEHVGSILLSSRRRTTGAEQVTRGERRPEA